MPKIKFNLLNHTRPNLSFEASYQLRGMKAQAFSADVKIPTGTVFNIQRCSVHDGPLSCTWCHNPEGIDAEPVLMISSDRCLGCRACSEACPVSEDGAVPAGEAWNRALCTRCGSCVEACPADARELAGHEYDASELVDVLERDRVFFETTDGGVTFSGGEPLAQPEFLMDCLRKCRRRGLRTAVDTCGLAPRQTVLEVAELADLVLFDLKHMDPERHHRETGVDNRIILRNLRALSESEVEIWIRIPLIPGFNDDFENIDATVAFLEGLPRRHRVWILPYHAIAEGKHARLEATGAQSDIRTPDTELLGSIEEKLAGLDLDVTVGGTP
jgi:pyruvate formate lyase activating enzyme